MNKDIVISQISNSIMGKGKIKAFMVASSVVALNANFLRLRVCYDFSINGMLDHNKLKIKVSKKCSSLYIENDSRVCAYRGFCHFHSLCVRSHWVSSSPIQGIETLVPCRHQLSRILLRPFGSFAVIQHVAQRLGRVFWPWNTFSNGP